MTLIKWVESVPSNASLVGLAPVDFKSVWTAIAKGMAVEHYWSGSGGGSEASIGDVRPGGSRSTDIDTSTGLSSVYANQSVARFAWALTDAINSLTVQRLRVYDSTGTYLAGTTFLEEHASNQTRGYWLRQAGAIASVPTGSSTTTTSFPTPYFAAPTVRVTSSSFSWLVCNASSSTTNFVSVFSSLLNASSTATIYWEALGVASSGSF